jgi:hypothetical protein
MKCAVIRSSDLFNPKNNPSGRMDAGFGIALASMIRGEVACLRDLFKSEQEYKKWVVAARSKETLQDLADHVAWAFNRTRKHAEFSKTVSDGIMAIAGDFAMEEAERLECISGLLKRKAEMFRSLSNKADKGECIWEAGAA